MTQVKAPYNFVPLNKKVFFPPWADWVTHDIPFKNGLSGQIELEITAETPIFIRKPYEKGDPEGSYYQNQNREKISKEFCHIKDKDGNKRYYIPGSSIRNMLRSVVEIMSFSKLNFINKPERFAFRDMANKNLYNLLNNASRLKMGWLVKDGSDVFIYDCGNLGDLRDRNNQNKVYRPNLYHQRDLEFFEKITNDDYSELVSPETSLARKYEIYNNPDNNYQNGYRESAQTLSTYDDRDFKDVIILTGNITGKRNEFIFLKPRECDEQFPIDDNLLQDFVIANTLMDGKLTDNWSFWKPKFENNEYVPVFFRIDDNGNVIDFGLTVLYKMSYKYKLWEILKRQQPQINDLKLDLAETIFGTIDEEKKEIKLKGRVQVGHAFSKNTNAMQEKTLVLGEPKISFYPYYIKQDVQNNGKLQNNGQGNRYVSYKTMSDVNSIISGRKRYPIHYRFRNNPVEVNPDMNELENENIQSHIKPLQRNTSFKTTINYNNLLPEELGALLSAITFHNTNTCRHNIGLAKPYGYGRIKIEIKNMDIDNQKKYMGIFEKLMRKFDTNWLQSEQIIELISMADVFPNQDLNKLKYLRLQEFQQLKRRNGNNIPKALPLYSKFMNHTKITVSINSNLNLTFIEKKENLEKFILNCLKNYQNKHQNQQ